MTKCRYTENEIREAVASSFSLKQAIEKLNIIAAGGNYKTIKRYIKLYNVDTSHMTGNKVWYKDRKPAFNIRPIEDYLNGLANISSHDLKKRLLKEGIFQHQCSSCLRKTWMCELTDWEEAPIKLELEHKDGDPDNNKLENLCLLCPLCHSYTLTYKGKNRAGYKERIKAGFYSYDKWTKIDKRRIRKDRIDSRKVVWPSKEELAKLIEELPWTKIGKMFGVTDNAVRKWARKYGLLNK